MRKSKRFTLTQVTIEESPNINTNNYISWKIVRYLVLFENNKGFSVSLFNKFYLLLNLNPKNFESLKISINKN